MVSLATLENEYTEPGTEVTVVWGEQPVSAKPAVEEHRQVEIRATVAPVPFVDFTRENYRGRLEPNGSRVGDGHGSATIRRTK